MKAHRRGGGSGSGDSATASRPDVQVQVVPPDVEPPGKPDEESSEHPTLDQAQALPAEAEVRSLFTDRVFPAVRDAIASFGSSVDEPSCHMAAAFTRIALRNFGITNAELFEGTQHIFVKVPTREGTTLILDAAAAQFFVNQTAIDDKLQSEGFVGTEEDLAQMLIGNIENWDTHGNLGEVDPEALKVFRGAESENITQRDADTYVGTFLDQAAKPYLEQGGIRGLSGASKRIEQMDAGERDEFVEQMSGKDRSEDMKRALATLHAGLEDPKKKG